ncbi:MAG: sugar isomerase [Candidatus Sulfotelmatobacter sp.]|jgi:glucosamine--fructose-6-phosphate aminotransferase (isomerizing)
MESQAGPESRWIAGVEPPSEMLTRSMTSIYEMECREQPEHLARLLRAYQEDKPIREAIEQLRQMALSAGPVMLVGMGASYCSSIIASSFLQSCGQLAFAADASEWLHYSRPVWDQAAVSILLTTSGESAELVQLCQNSARLPIALLCNNEKSTCWSSIEVKLPILAGPEYGNATKTFTNATAACIVFASHILGRAWREDAQRASVAYAAALDKVFSLRGELEKFCRGAANIELVGRGPAYGAAIMGSLCIREMTGHRAAAYSGGGFRHGPLLDVDGSHVAIISALGRAAGLGVDLAHDCHARGGRVILVGTEERQASERFFPVTIGAVPEPWEGITSVLVPQALTLAMAEEFGAKLPPRFQYGIMKE